MSYDERGVRAVRKVIEIGAPVELVWEALTTGEGLRSWYLERAEVEPGVGGKVTGGWGPTELPPATIEVWEPNAHFRTRRAKREPTRGFGTGLAGREDLAEGMTLTLRPGDGPALHAELTQWAAPIELAATVTSLDDARLLISIMPGGEGSYVALYLFCYGLSDEAVDGVEARFREALRAVGELTAA